MITFTYDIDMTPGERPVEINLNRNDADFTLIFNLFSCAGELDIKSGTTAKIRGRKPSGDSYEADAFIDLSTNTVTVNGTSDMTDEAGSSMYEICLTHASKELYSSNFHIIVEQITQLE